MQMPQSLARHLRPGGKTSESGEETPERGDMLPDAAQTPAILEACGGEGDHDAVRFDIRSFEVDRHDDPLGGRRPRQERLRL